MNNIQKAFRDKAHLGLRMADGGLVDMARQTQLGQTISRRNDAMAAMERGEAPQPAPASTPDTQPQSAAWQPVKKSRLGVIKSLIGLREGGRVAGPGTSTSDSVPAMLSHGEYVLPADTVRAIGVSKLNGLRAATHNAVPARYADGVEHRVNGGEILDWAKDRAGDVADLAKSGYNAASGYVRGLGGSAAPGSAASGAAPNYDIPPEQRGFESKVQPDIESRTSSTGKSWEAPRMDGAAQAGDQSAARAANTVEGGMQGPSSSNGLRTAAPGETPPKGFMSRATNWTARKAFEAVGGDTKVPSFKFAPKGSIGPVRQGMGAATLAAAPNLVLRGARSMGYDVPDQALSSTGTEPFYKDNAVVNPLRFIGTGLAESYARNAPEWAGGLSQKTLDAADKAGVSAWDNTPFAVGRATFNGKTGEGATPSNVPAKKPKAAVSPIDPTAEALSQLGVSPADQAGPKMSLNDALRTSQGEFGPAQPGKNYRLGLGSSPDTQMYVRLQGAPTKEEGAATTPGQLNDRLMSIQRGQTGAYGLGGSKFSDAEVDAINKGIRARGLAGATFTGVGKGQSAPLSGSADPVEETARAYQKAFAKGDWNNAIPLKRVLDAQLQMRSQDTQLAGHNMQRQLGVANFQRQSRNENEARILSRLKALSTDNSGKDGAEKLNAELHNDRLRSIQDTLAKGGFGIGDLNEADLGTMLDAHANARKADELAGGLESWVKRTVNGDPKPQTSYDLTKYLPKDWRPGAITGQDVVVGIAGPVSQADVAGGGRWPWSPTADANRAEQIMKPRTLRN